MEKKTLNVYFSLFVGEGDAMKYLPSEKRENSKEKEGMGIKRKRTEYNTKRIEENNGRERKVRKTGRWGETN